MSLFFKNFRGNCLRYLQYLLARWTNVGGSTVLVDKDGKPLLDEQYADRSR